MSTPGRRESPVLAILDEPAAAAVALELTVSLARALQRDVGIVHVESESALGAAALPVARVLPHAGAGWQPLSRSDVEQGFRAQAARLQTIAARIARSQSVNWSIRTVRGEAARAAFEVSAEADLVLLAGRPLLLSAGPAESGGPARGPRRRPVVTVAGDGDGRARDVATLLVRTLAGVLENVGPARPDSAADFAARIALTDLLVIPRDALDVRVVAALRCPVLLVG